MASHIAKDRITVFEHQSLKVGQLINSSAVEFDDQMLNALQNFYGDNGVPFYSLIHKGVRFNEYVGVIQIGSIQIEVLPKADKNFSSSSEEQRWRDVLIGMLRAVGTFNIQATSDSNLKVKNNSILDLYFELFIKEVEFLHHQGLIKKYSTREGNVTALKGNIIFSNHLKHNVIHHERFYVRHTVYDVNHKLHHILYKTLNLLKAINNNPSLQSRICTLLLNFPEMPISTVIESTFSKLVFNRQNMRYRPAINIAKMILLQFHPDLINGRNHVLALMFDMNMLWEKFVYVSIAKNRDRKTSIEAQNSKYFWKSEKGNKSSIRPDILINKNDNERCMVLDTKWKNLNGDNPSVDDLRQMYIYHEYYRAKKVALLYPGDSIKSSGYYYCATTNEISDRECSIIRISVNSNITAWQKSIYYQFKKWADFE